MYRSLRSWLSLFSVARIMQTPVSPIYTDYNTLACTCGNSTACVCYLNWKLVAPPPPPPPPMAKAGLRCANTKHLEAVATTPNRGT